MEQRKKVGIWIRVSTEDQAKGESPDNHEARARSYAEFQGWHVHTVYHLEAVSGKFVMEHPETKRMLHDVQSGKISGLIFSKLARLARNTRELLEFSEIFQEAKSDLISLQELIDTSSPAGRLFFTIIAAMAQWEREEIADRVKASVPIRAKLGKSLGGAAPYGYVWINKKLEINEEEAQVRRLIFELFREHKRKRRVANILNDRGYRTRNGSKFTYTTVVRLLTDPLAKGLRRSNYTSSLGEGKNWVLKDKKDWVFNEAPAIVSEELWDECNRIIDEQNITAKKPSKETTRLFTGVAVCECGSKMYVPSNAPKYICYKCRNKVPETDLEEIFHEQLKAFLISDKKLAKHFKSYDSILKQKEEEIQLVQNQIDNLYNEQRKILNRFGDESVAKEVFQEHWNPVNEEYLQKKNHLLTLQSEIDQIKFTQASTDQAIHDARDLYGKWEEMNRGDKRLLVESITDKITIGKEDIHIELKYLPTTHPSNSWQNGHASMPLRLLQPPRAGLCLRTGCGESLFK